MRRADPPSKGIDFARPDTSKSVMPSIRVPLQIHSGHRWISPLSWEPRCLVCNDPMEGEANASMVNPNKFLTVSPLVFWSSEHFDVSYPVCMRHRRMCNLLDWPSRRGAIVSLVCWLLLPAVFWLAFLIGVIDFRPNLPVLARQVLAVALAISLWGSMTFWYSAAYFLKPVKLSKLSRTHITVTIRNKIAFLHVRNADMASTATPTYQDRAKSILSPPEQPSRRLQFKRHPG
jgi:hypothetical protein